MALSSISTLVEEEEACGRERETQVLQSKSRPLGFFSPMCASVEDP
jgi:hypothetical protein